MIRGDEAEQVNTFESAAWRRVAKLALEALRANPNHPRAAMVLGVARARLGREDSVPATATGGTFIGRNPEIEHLARRVDAAAKGTGSACALVGEPGVGKSLLAEIAQWYARAQGLVVLRASCHEESRPAFGVWIQALRELGEALGWEAVGKRAGPSRAHLVPLLPELGGAAARVRSRNHDPSVGIGRPSGQGALAAAICALLRDVTATTPILVSIDDLHWADAQSLRVLGALAAELPRLRLHVLCTYRNTEPRSLDTLAPVVTELIRQADAVQLDLCPFSAQEVAAFVHAATGTAPTPSRARELVHLTNGNPLFLSQLARSGALDAGRLAEGTRAGAAPLPTGVRELVQDRVGHLSAATRDVLAVVAVAGDECSLPILQAALGSDGGDGLLRCVDEARRAGILEALDDARTRYRFVHGLVRDGIASSLPLAAAKRFHGTVAAAIEKVHADDLAPHASEVLYHLAQSDGRADACTMALYAALAGEHARATCSFAQSAEHFAAGLAALGGSGDAALRARLEAGRAGALWLADSTEVARAAEHVSRALAGFAQSRDREGLARMASRWEIRDLCRRVPFGELALVERAAAICPDSPAVLILHGYAHLHAGEAARALDRLRSAAAAAREAKDPDGEAGAEEASVYVALGLGLFEEALEHARGGARVEAAEAVECSQWEVNLLRHLGRPKEAWEASCRLLARAREDSAPGFVYAVSYEHIWLLISRGAWDEAARLIGRLELLGSGLADIDRARFPMLRDWIGYYRGDTSAITDALARAETRVREDKYDAWDVLYVMRDALENGSGSVPLLEAMCGEGRAPLKPNIGRRGDCLIEACRALTSAIGGDTRRALDHLSAVDPPLLDWSWVVTGVLHRLCGELDRAAEDLCRGVEHFAHDAVAEGSWAHLALGECRLARNRPGDRDAGVEHLREGLGIAREFGMRGYEAMAARYARAYGIEELDATTGPTMTPRESEVLSRVALGRTNKEIASELGISIRTVHRHVEAILRKTGSGNRTEAARYAIEHGIRLQASESR
jgi:DNA-binding CsgD family transcriptional regulator